MTDKKLRCIQIGTALVAVCFIILGVVRGENNEVLKKAVQICLQCIGIG